MTFSECTAIAKVFTLYELTRAQLTARSDKDLRANAIAIARLEQAKPNAATADLDKVAALLFPGSITDHPAFRRLMGNAPGEDQPPRPPQVPSATPVAPPSPARNMAQAPAIAPTGATRPIAAPSPSRAAPTPPAAPPQPVPNTPLSPIELSTLARLLPQCNPKRFLTKHTPARWREVLARLIASAS